MIQFKRNVLISGIILCTYFFSQTSYGQEVIIGNATSSNNALLNIGSGDQGILLPRLTSAQRAGISNPANGLIVYDVTEQSYFYYNNRAGWQEMHPVPRGTVTMWYSNNINEYFNTTTGLGKGHMLGWALCNGGNGTPNMEGNFVVGYSGSGEYAANKAPGGADEVGLGINNLPSHTHAISDPGHSHTVTLPANTSHSHTFNYSSSSYDSSYGRADDNNTIIAYRDGGTIVDYDITTSSGSFTTSMSSAGAGISLQNNGADVKFDNRPPFYVLVYIVKL